MVFVAQRSLPSHRSPFSKFQDLSKVSLISCHRLRLFLILLPSLHPEFSLPLLHRGNQTVENDLAGSSGERGNSNCCRACPEGKTSNVAGWRTGGSAVSRGELQTD